MAIPLYAAQAHGGKLIELDAQSVVKDLAAADGTGGNAYAAFVLGALVDDGHAGGFGHLRRIIQRVTHDGAVTVKVTPYRDGNETGQVIQRTLGASDNPTVVAPVNQSGSTFQIRLELSAFDAVAALGSGEFTIIPRRSHR